MRLIDADALLDRIPNPYEQAHVARWVNEEPTVSAEPKIIRCEYCTHRNQYRFPPKYEVRDYCEVHEKVTTITNFCSWAERREDG